ncbi:MAG: PHP-associated domain-containing protein [archaeon]
MENIEKFVRVDLHNHLAHDNLKCFEREKFLNKVIDKSYDTLGDGGVVGLANCVEPYGRYEKFTELSGYERVEFENALYFPEKKILVVKAQEVFADKGDILALGIPKNYHIGKLGEVRKRSIEDAIKQAKDLGAIIGIDHGCFIDGAIPYLRKNLKLLEDVDFIEPHNGNAWIPHPKYFRANKQAQEFYREVLKEFPHLGGISSSDGHSVFEIGSSYSSLDMKIEDDLTESLRKAIRNHKDWSRDKMSNSYLGAGIHAGLMLLFQKKPESN